MTTTIETKVRVCVVGCGVSGAAAAGELVTAGVEDVLVVEAVGRPGGRVHTLKHGDGFIEIGAHWIHGEEGNCIFEWAKENCPEAINTVLDITQTGKGNCIFVDSHGTPVPVSVIDAFEDVVAAIDNADMSESDCSLGEFYQQRFSGVNLWGTAGWQLLEWHGRYQSMIDGSDSWHSVSAATRNEYWECPGNLVINWNTSGYQTIIDHLMSRVGPECVLLNSPVTRIEWAGDCSQQSPEAAPVSETGGSGVSTPQGSACSGAGSCITATECSPAAHRQKPQCARCGCRASCRVTLPDRVVVADHVIFSGSLGVLKDTAHHLFQPPLPPRKLLTIEGLGFDTVAKVYLQFESSWWPEDCSGFSFLQDLTGTPPDPVEEWEQHLLGFYTVWQQPRLLCGWMSGPSARAMELTPLPDVITRCHAVLKDRLRHVCQVPRPDWGTRSSWGSNPYTRGAYSFRSCRSDERDVWADDLAAPVTVAGCPVVCFCGEATHRHYYSTVHGAWESGVREAKRLLQHWRGEELTKKPEEEAEAHSALLETEQ